jgi:hypothetical protein
MPILKCKIHLKEYNAGIFLIGQAFLFSFLLKINDPKSSHTLASKSEQLKDIHREKSAENAMAEVDLRLASSANHVGLTAYL